MAEKFTFLKIFFACVFNQQFNDSLRCICYDMAIERKARTKEMKYVPLEKMSKKEQRRHHAAKRGDWNGVVPVTRMIENKKPQKLMRDKCRAQMSDI